MGQQLIKITMPNDHIFSVLKNRHRTERDGYPPELSLRVHRALSWLNRTEQNIENDLDGSFIFLWIAFNAAYAQEFDNGITESEQQREFFSKLVELDHNKRIYQLLWEKYSGAVRLILDNCFVFQPFWDYHNKQPGGMNWEVKFANSRKHTQKALANTDTVIILGNVFNRLYTLRNQILHGGATWNSQVNRNQLRDAVNILSALVPIIIETMMDHPHADWGKVCYPVVDQ